MIASGGESLNDTRVRGDPDYLWEILLGHILEELI
jgi:hypothetical protein